MVFLFNKQQIISFIQSSQNNNFNGSDSNIPNNNTNNNNTACGSAALYNNTSGYYNTAVGFNALNGNISNFASTAVGYDALLKSTANYNTAIGHEALYANTTGYDNTACGLKAGYTNATDTSCTFIGWEADANGNYQNSAAFGNGATAMGRNKQYFGNSAVVGLYTTSGLFATSDGRFKTNVTENVKGLEFIKKLRPITYNLNTLALDNFIIQYMVDSMKTLHQGGMDFASSTAKVHSGFIAHEVEQAAQQVGFTSSIVSHPSNSSDTYGLNYAEIVVPLVKAVQELSKSTDSLKTKTINQDSINKVLAKKDSINTAKLQALQTKDSLNTIKLLTMQTLDSLNTINLQNQINQLMATINACCASNNQNRSMQAPTDNSQSLAKQIDVELSNKNIVVLDQNVPNPFADQTVINYYLPDNFTKAQIIFLDQSGKLIKTVDLTEKGKGSLNVFANDLTNGVYTYSLIVDGQTMETKKMVKSK